MGLLFVRIGFLVMTGVFALFALANFLLRHFSSKIVKEEAVTIQVVRVSDRWIMHLHTQNRTPMAVAILPRTHLFGKYTIHFRADALHGFKTSWVLWPDSWNWLNDGETDLPENTFLHHQHARTDKKQSASYATTLHTATITWRARNVAFTLDGKAIGGSTTRIPATTMLWFIQTESCLDGCPAISTVGNLQIVSVVASAPTT